MTAILSSVGRVPLCSRISRETRNRFGFANAAKALKRSEHQHEVHEETGAQRHKQKALATQSAICCHYRTKTAGEPSRAQRFSRATSHRRYWCCKCPLSSADNGAFSYCSLLTTCSEPLLSRLDSLTSGFFESCSLTRSMSVSTSLFRFTIVTSRS